MCVCKVKLKTTHVQYVIKILEKSRQIDWWTNVQCNSTSFFIFNSLLMHCFSLNIGGYLGFWIGFRAGQKMQILACEGRLLPSPWNFPCFHLFTVSQLSSGRSQSITTDWGRYFWASGLLSCFSGTIIIVIIAAMGLLFCLSDSIWPISPRQEVLHYYFSPLHSHETMSGRGIC